MIALSTRLLVCAAGAFGAFLAACFLSGPLRAASRFSIEICLIAGLLIVGGLLFIGSGELLRAARQQRAQWISGFTVTAILSSVVAGYSIVRLYNPHYAGLVSVGGGDAGNLVHFKELFIQDRPNVYNSFVSFLAVVHWVEVFFLVRLL